jgi:peptidoglycan/LPS O-acetylase OafA/YrhL
MLITTLSLKLFFYGLPDADNMRILARDAFYCLTYTTNFARIADVKAEGGMWQNAWSLAVEEQFYVVWSVLLPLLMLIGKRWQIGVVAALTAASCFAKYSEFRNVLGLSIWIHHWTGPFGNIWKMLLGASLRLFPLPSCLQTRWTGYAGIVLLTAIQLHAWFAVGDWTWKEVPSTLFYETTSSFAAVPIIFGALAYDNRILCMPPLVFVGRISYSFYLYQVPLLTIAARPHGGWPRGYPGFAITVLAALCAVASTLYVEEPIRRLYRQRMSKSSAMKYGAETNMQSVQVVD